MVFYLFWKFVFSLFDKLLNALILHFAHFVNCHPTNWTINAIKTLETLQMNQMATFETLIVFSRVFKYIQAYRTLGFGNILIAFMFSLFGNMPAISTFMAMEKVLRVSSSAHLAIILN